MIFQRQLTKILLLLALLFCISASESASRTQQFKPHSENNSQNLVTQDELYFDFSTPGSRKISDAEWQEFLDKQIFAKFAKGLTLLNTSGQLFQPPKIVIEEPNKLIILVYQNSDLNRRLVQEMIENYQQKFGQESVLRVTSSVEVRL